MKNFTLLEVAIVLAIVTILFSIAMPSFLRARERALEQQKIEQTTVPNPSIETSDIPNLPSQELLEEERDERVDRIRNER